MVNILVMDQEAVRFLWQGVLTGQYTINNDVRSVCGQ